MYSPHIKSICCWCWTVSLSFLVASIVVLSILEPFDRPVTFGLIVLLGLVSILLIWHVHNKVKHYLKERYSLLEADLSKDPVTRLAGKDALTLQLQTECRRAIREYSPLSIIGVTLTESEPLERDVKLVSMVLKQLLHRPGDIVYRLDDTTFILLLPSTNERVLAFCERCHGELTRANITVSTKVSVCTFQPSAELNDQHVLAKLQRLIESNRRQNKEAIMSLIEQPIDPSVLHDDL